MNHFAMRNSCVLLFFVALVLPTACSQPVASEGDSALNEIPLEGDFSNAALIRNPVNPEAEGSVEQAPVIVFSKEKINFGEVTERQVVELDFAFENKGKSPLLITRAYSTCGCTVPEWPQTPLAPGESGVIHVRFDTDGKSGMQRKPIYIMANTLPSRNTVYLEGMVQAAE